MNKGQYFQAFLMSIAITLLTYLNFRYPFSLGGSSQLIALGAGILIASFKMKKHFSEFGVNQVIIVCIIGMNFLAYWENSGKHIGIPYLVIFFSCLIYILLQYIANFEKIFRTLRQLNEYEQKLLKHIRKTLKAPIYFVGSQFALIGSLMVYIIHEDDPNIYYSIPLLRMPYVAFAMMIFFFSISYIYLRKVKEEDIRLLLLKADEKYNLRMYDARKIKKYALLIYAGIFITGSGIEILRGMWIMWFETIILLGLMILILWKIYKHLFSEDGSSKEQIAFTKEPEEK